MRKLAVIAVLSLLTACKANIQNKDAVRDSIVDYLKARQAKTGLNMDMMDVEVSTISFSSSGNEAHATVKFTPKAGGGGMDMPYTLDRSGNKWVVRAHAEGGENPHGAAGSPGTAAESSSRGKTTMKTVAVLGGGRAGAFAAERLASAGLKTILFDEKLAWEKPCGGGLTYKAYHEYPFLVDNETPKKFVSETTLSAQGAGAVKMQLEHPLVIYSRMDLNRMLLDRAQKSGAQIEQTRVMGLERRDRGWNLRTRCGIAEADFCVVATGARNPLREVGTQWSAKDTMTALGYYVPSSQDHIDIQFLPRLEGYIWVFPRCGHLSVGICGKGEPAQALRTRLEAYMSERGISYKEGKFYSHMLPSLETPGWRGNRVSGDGWLAVGDAGGLVDPITGEGLYYAMRSGDLASRVVIDDAHGIAEKAAAYRALLAREFALDLEFAATLAKRVFLGSFLFSSVPARMVQYIRSSPRFRALMQDLFAGTQPYGELKSRLLRNLNGTLQEVLMNFFLHRVIPENSRVVL